MTHLILVTSSALDLALMSGGFSDETMKPINGRGVYECALTPEITGYRTYIESDEAYTALINIECIEQLYNYGVRLTDLYRRIARVVSSMKSPPIHLPRQWSEFHYKNLLAFYAAQKEIASERWVAEIRSDIKCSRFDYISAIAADVDLKTFFPRLWPDKIEFVRAQLIEQTLPVEAQVPLSLAAEIDLKAIGSASVVKERSYSEWERFLTEPQKTLLREKIDKSIRIVGPAGSGKTLSLCMRSIMLSRDELLIAEEKKILIVTHSWAMSERIDGVLLSLNDGVIPDRITVFPLIGLLEMHVGTIGQRRIDIIGDDSSDGRRRTLLMLQEIVDNTGCISREGLSTWIKEGIDAADEGSARRELVRNLYEEITGVLAASGVSPDDNESVRTYMRSDREDWMPPFETQEDRAFVVRIYEVFIKELVDREAVTTDQFILDSIRMLETFNWRMRKETEGYDFIFVDELQLFDPQERAALELLGRLRMGVPFVTAEDPSQGVFSSINRRHNESTNEMIYLETVHRFNRGIFDFISFIYGRFPLNAIPLKTKKQDIDNSERPIVYACDTPEAALDRAVSIAHETSKISSAESRICVATLGDFDTLVANKLEERALKVTLLSSFDDVEQLAYSKRSIVVSPWEFVGGTQFSHVIVVAAGLASPRSQFARRREMISVYLSCSRAADRLHIICDSYIPSIVQAALENGLVSQGT